MSTTLRIDASARGTGSLSRDLGDRVAETLASGDTVLRDLNEALPQVDAEWVAARLVPEAERTDADRAKLALSDALVDELQAADTILITTPIFNFTIPASLKLWIDLVARPGVTFSYTPDGPKGLLEGKRAIIVVASGGTKLGTPIDFASPYLRHVLKFIGITDVTFVTSDTIDAFEAGHDTLLPTAA